MLPVHSGGSAVDPAIQGDAVFEPASACCPAAEPEAYSIVEAMPHHFPLIASIMLEVRREMRISFPMLSPRIADPAVVELVLAKRRDGLIACAPDGRASGFLLADRLGDLHGRVRVVASPDCFVLAPGANPRALVALYEAGFGRSEPRASEHVTFCPSNNEPARSALESLGFRIERVYAASRLVDLRLIASSPPGVLVSRVSGRHDDERRLRESLLGVSGESPDYRLPSPRHAKGPRSAALALKDATDQEASRDRSITVAAYRGGRIIGYQIWAPLTHHILKGATEDAIGLVDSVLLPAERGRGVTRAMASRALLEAGHKSFARCFVEWRTASRSATSPWIRLGFVPFLDRMVKRERLRRA
jgi:GNAT superfamily N-acetyltransferase